MSLGCKSADEIAELPGAPPCGFSKSYLSLLTQSAISASEQVEDGASYFSVYPDDGIHGLSKDGSPGQKVLGNAIEV
jgi:hypothetical protein